MGDAGSADDKIGVDDQTIAGESIGSPRDGDPKAPAARQADGTRENADLDPSTIPSDVAAEASSASPEPDRSGSQNSSSASDPGAATSDGNTALPPSERPIPVVDGYEILGELGRGGMGIVYRAREVRLNRPCALKMILAGSHADAEAAVRFLAEAEAVARLKHPNIVQIHHIASSKGLPFFELEYVEGGSLDQRLDGTPWPARQAAELIEALARGVAEAHRLGIVHRDLKPANILLTSDDAPKITDFGLAKSLNLDSGLTKTDSIMGSPNYMAPEQAAGNAKEVGPLADVYSLGAMSYELLTGRPPFKAATILETLEQVRTAEPVSPARLAPGIPRDVETIALKCLEKEPDKRYNSAEALANDLRSFLDNESIVARPAPQWERVFKWARRRPAIATLVVVVHVLLAALLCLGIWSYARINQSLKVARKERERAIEQTTVANQRAEDLAWEDYINRVNRAYREVQDDNIELAEDMLQGCPTERRGWEWHYVNRQCHAERLTVETPAGLVHAVAFSPDGRLIATATGGPFSVGEGGPNVVLWDRETGQRQLALSNTNHHIWSLAFSPDGTKLAVGGRGFPAGSPQVMVLDAMNGQILWSRHDPELPQAMSVAFSPDGHSLAVGYGLYSKHEAFRVTLYEAATGKETNRFPGPLGGVNDLAYHPDGRHLAVAGAEIVEIWDVVAGVRVHELRGHSKWVYCVAFSPDGKWLATGGWDRRIKLWEATTGREHSTISAHDGFVLDVAFSPDSRSVASTSEDRSVRLWEVPTGGRLGVLHGHTDFVQTVAFAPDGREMATGGVEGTMKIWDRRASLPVVVSGHSNSVVGLWYRRDGRRITSFSSPVQGQGVRTSWKSWNPGTGEEDPTSAGIDRIQLEDDYLPCPIPIIPGSPLIHASATSSDAKLVASVVRNSANVVDSAERSKSYGTNTVEIRDAATGRVLHALVGHTADVVCIQFSPDGQRIATTSFDQTIKLWDTDSGREVFTLRGHTAGVIALIFSPDGHRIVSGGIDYTARVWDATPLPDASIEAQKARYNQKKAEFEALRNAPNQAENAQGESTPSSGREWLAAAEWFASEADRETDTEKNLLRRRQQILSLLVARHTREVARACADLLDKFGAVTDSEQANLVAWTCVLAPDAVADREAPVRLAEAALATCREQTKGDVLKTLGAALYRAGRFENAIRRLNESIQAPGDQGNLTAYGFLAMAHHRLRQRGDAERWLGNFRASMPNEGYDASWDDVENRILLREVESLILQHDPATSLKDVGSNTSK